VLTPPGTVSVLIPCLGQLEYTKLCVPSVLRHSRAPYELIFLDVGSLDGTAEYLAGVQAAAGVRVEVVRTATDLGLGAAVREALARAWGEFFVLLNNDTLVTDGWLDQLKSLAGMSPAIGMVGPMSNYAAPPQWVEGVPYRLGPRKGSSGTAEALVDVEAVARFGRDFREQHKGKWLEVERLGGFCVLVKRDALVKAGPLDDAAGLGPFDTDALSQRVRRAGYTLACCKDLFVHHFGGRTFAHGAPAPAETTPLSRS
jgi:GT2 family glycosyltransferase